MYNILIGTVNKVSFKKIIIGGGIVERMYAFTAGSGNYGFDFGQEGVSGYFMVTAVLIPESVLNSAEDKTEEIWKRYFHGEGMESSSEAENHRRQYQILQDLMEVDFRIFSVVVDKKILYGDSGFMHKESFFDFVNNLVHRELRYAFGKLAICADEAGQDEYMKSFCEYIRIHEDIPDLFGEKEFYLEGGRNKVLLQLADFIGGTLSFVYETDKQTEVQGYLKLLDRKMIRIEQYPKDISGYVSEKGAVSGEYNLEITKICQRHIRDFLEKYKNTTDEDRLNQIIVLKYLSFRFLNSNTGKYIPTRELISNLKYRTGKNISMQYFRTRIIAKLRDEGVIIASSPKGYKIPSGKEELYDFINHGTNIIMPMLARLKKCRDNISLGTGGKLDLFDNTEYKTLKQFFDL